MAEPLLAGPFSKETSPRRARIRDVVIGLVIEHGFEATTVEMVLERAQLTRADFDRDFESLADCCLQIYLANVAEYDRLVLSAADDQGSWRERLRAVAYGTARYVQGRPQETRFDMIQMLGAGEMAQAQRDLFVARIVDLIDAGRQELDEPNSIGRGVAEGVLGSIYETLAKEIQQGRGTRSATDYVPQLMYIAVRPYLGHEAALEELEIPPPPEPGQSAEGTEPK